MAANVEDSQMGSQQASPPTLAPPPQQQVISRRTLSFIKYLILIMTGMCVVMEVIQIVVGAGAGNFLEDFRIFISSSFYSVTTFIMAFGVILLLVVLLGFVGIVIEGVTIIAVYIILFTMLAVMEIVLAISAFVMTRHVDDMLEVNMMDAFWQFRRDPAVRHSVHHMQRTLECCGFNSYVDWDQWNNETRLPSSCYATFDEGSVPFQEGCFLRMSEVMGNLMNILASGTMIIVIFQIICIISAIVLMIKLKNFNKYHRTRSAQNATEVDAPTIVSPYGLETIREEKGDCRY